MMPGVMFCLGFFAVLAQVIFVRETMVVFSPNEMGIGTVMAGWLSGIGLGAFAAHFLPVRHHRRVVLAGIMIALALILPFQIYIIRIARSIFGVPVGEPASLFVTLTGSFLIFLPTCFLTGFAFPLICDLSEGRHRVSFIYALDAAGSMAGGLILTFLMLPRVSPYVVVLAGSGIALAGAAFAGRRWSVVLICFAALAVALISGRGSSGGLESFADTARWKAAGLISEDESAGRLVRSVDTKYQNLALIESHGQYTMLGNGKVLFSFPDPMTYEHSVHFIMAQKPGARSVLLIGGNPAGDIPELLKYPLERLVCVDLDPGMHALVQDATPDEYERVMSGGRVKMIYEDAPRFINGCNDKFDVVIINTSEPSTAWENRIYTKEFYRNVRNVMTDGGFLCAAAGLSDRLRSGTADLGSSIYKTLQSVFPVVLVTAGEQALFFAGDTGSGLTFDRNILFERSRAAGLQNKYFRPEYFLGSDEIDPVKTAYVRERFDAVDAPVNSDRNPVTYYYSLLVWGQKSGAFTAGLIGLAGRLKAWHVILFMLLAGVAGLVTGIMRRGSSGWTRAVAGLTIGSTGFCGMAIEILLIFVFQAAFGYVYSRIGLIVALFMAGLVTGAFSGSRFCGEGNSRAWRVLIRLELFLFILIAGLPYFTAVVSEPVMYGLVLLSGWVVGAEFPAGNRLFKSAGGSLKDAAAVTDASDHIGAALGALLTGVFLIPVFGVTAACMVLAAVKLSAIMMLLTSSTGWANEHLTR